MTREDRLNAVRLMHGVMTSMNNEDAYMAWIWVMPDEPSEDDFEYFADEIEFDELKQTFDRLFNRYKKDGLFEPTDEELSFLFKQGYSTHDIDIFRRD